MLVCASLSFPQLQTGSGLISTFYPQDCSATNQKCVSQPIAVARRSDSSDAILPELAWLTWDFFSLFWPQKRTFCFSSYIFSYSEFKRLPCNNSGQKRKPAGKVKYIFWTSRKTWIFQRRWDLNRGECFWFSSNDFQHFCFLLSISQDSFQPRCLLLKIIIDNLINTKKMKHHSRTIMQCNHRISGRPARLKSCFLAFGQQKKFAAKSVTHETGGNDQSDYEDLRKSAMK